MTGLPQLAGAESTSTRKTVGASRTRRGPTRAKLGLIPCGQGYLLSATEENLEVISDIAHQGYLRLFGAVVVGAGHGGGDSREVVGAR